MPWTTTVPAGILVLFTRIISSFIEGVAVGVVAAVVVAVDRRFREGC